jgi:flavin reductase (DIM6/NTAB) family NADH-FMN oxidoreductase RutF
MKVRPNQVSHREFYRILISSVAPRPIAWVSTLSKAGRPNLAPFSFFTVVSAMPPVLGFSPALRQLERGHEVKGTLVNIRDTKEFVVNMVTYEMAEAMNLSSGDYEYTVDEFELAELATRASEIVRPPQVALSPVSFECRLYQIIDFGHEPPSGSFVMGEIVCAYIADDIVTQGQLDPNALDLIGRMGGSQYTRTTERFEMARPAVRR